MRTTEGSIHVWILPISVPLRRTATFVKIGELPATRISECRRARGESAAQKMTKIRMELIKMRFRYKSESRETPHPASILRNV